MSAAGLGRVFLSYRRLDDPDDIVCLEIGAALARDIRVIHS